MRRVLALHMRPDINPEASRITSINHNFSSEHVSAIRTTLSDFILGQ